MLAISEFENDYSCIIVNNLYLEKIDISILYFLNYKNLLAIAGSDKIIRFFNFNKLL